MYARLLEYQDELAELQTLFATGTPYTNPRKKSDAKANALVGRFRIESHVYEERAASLVSAWQGSENEKIERLIQMLELEIQKCKRFVAAVLEPVSPRAPQLPQTYPAEALTESGSKASGVEALVVGIKFHRGNADGIAPGESVQLVREPNNAYDPNAIRVNLRNGETLGYLTKEVAAVFAKQLDSGGDVLGQISKIVRDKVYVAVNPRRS
ncbi:MAG: HIRAN domain-containing protein [Verrucomicrobia bacterium]|nr:HIRAN domain-containing protein [Verrucomicrobiota bacterium]